MIFGKPVRQIAYFVDDVREASRRHVELFGSGPFFVLDHPPLNVIYRGQPAALDQTVTLGQWGSVQVEFIQQNTPGASIYEDVYPPGSGRTGIHHAAIFVDDLEIAVAAATKAGYPEAMRLTVEGTDIVVAFMDAVSTYGHFIELYEPKPLLRDIYERVAAAAEGFDGRDPIREASL